MKIAFSLPLIFSMIFGGFFGTLTRLWTLSRASWDDTIILFFSNYGWAGAEVVHLEITRQLYQNNKVFIIFQYPYEKEPNYREEFIKHSDGICVLQEESIYRRLIVRYIKFKLKRIPKTVLFGSYSYIFYRVLKGAKKHKIIDLTHAFDATYELLALPVIPELDQRIIISEPLRGKLHKLYMQKGIDIKYMDRVTCIPNGIPMNNTYPSGKDFNRLKLLFVGRDAPEKRLYLIKRILEKLIENGIDFSFTAVGGEFKLFKKFAHLPQVRCLGILERTALKEVYRQANILLMTSSREGFPMVMMEAMAEGVIPVSTDVGGIPGNIVHLETGVLIPDDLNEDVIVENFYKNLLMLRSEKSKMNQFSKAAFQYAKDNFSIEKFNERYDLLFDEILQNETLN
jgi:glycosyltransferase involved in cell wall biosynthesis